MAGCARKAARGPAVLRDRRRHPRIQRQPGHAHLSRTGTHLHGISSKEIISTVHARRAPMMHASAGLAQSNQQRERVTRSRPNTGPPVSSQDGCFPRHR
jgi:hypothetical protein